MSTLISSWKCPSNIALVKYWGKKKEGVQLPANASLSLNLSDLYTITTVKISSGNISGQPSFDFNLDGAVMPGFNNKVNSFLLKLWDDYSLVRDYHISIESVNNFPHATGIASSASGFGALALCVADLQQQLTKTDFPDFYRESSRIARLGSGSACRSIYPGVVIWGKTAVQQGSHDEYAVPADFKVDGELSDLMDAVLLVDDSEKKVSSTEGHALLDHNPYADERFRVAQIDLVRIEEAMKKGSVRSFIHIVESEALQLHAMMMVSSPYYVLMRPNTLEIIEKIWEYRQKTGTPVMFTLDAGANVHLLYPAAYNEEVVNFIKSDLLSYCKNGKYLCTTTGKGPEKLQ